MNENFVDYYKVLNIDIEATSIEIKNSYLKMAKKHHPDHSTNGGNTNFTSFKRRIIYSQYRSVCKMNRHS